MLGRIWRLWRDETLNLHLRLRLTELLVAPLPHFCFNRLRTALYRMAGVSIGRNTLIMGRMEITGGGAIEKRLSIGNEVQITAPLLADVNAPIAIGDGVSLGHHVQLITTNHQIGATERRCGAPLHAPIAIESGAWIGAGAIVLPGVVIGSGSVVGAGAVVTRSVAPNTLVGGVPARLIRALEESEKP
jgi:maltose O-acetyltransferase